MLAILITHRTNYPITWWLKMINIYLLFYADSIGLKFRFCLAKWLWEFMESIYHSIVSKSKILGTA